MADAESDPLMEETVGVHNTTLQFLRSFSVLSDDSDFDELDEPDTLGEFLDPADEFSNRGDSSASIRHTVSSGICVETGKPLDDHAGINFKMLRFWESRLVISLGIVFATY